MPYRQLVLAALREVTASAASYLTKFDSAFKKPTLFDDWDHYLKNPEMPEEPIEDIYGGDEDWDDGLDDPEQMLNNALDEVHSGENEGPEWEKAAKKYLARAYKDFQKDFKKKAEFENGKLVVHRTLTTHGDNDELIEGWDDPSYNAGAYWSWTPEPRAHWGGRGRTATMIGLVSPKAIDFEKSLVKNLHPTLGSEETEIELKPGAEIEVIKLQEGRRNTLWEGSKEVRAALRKVLATPCAVEASTPKQFFHETLLDNLASIENKGITPQTGSIVRQAYEQEDGQMPKGAAFLSTEEDGLGYFIAWQIANKLDKNIDEITWDDMAEHGLLAVIDTASHDDRLCPLYQYIGDRDVINLEGESVEYVEDDNGDDIHIDNIPYSIERGDWFSLACAIPDKYVKGNELVRYLKRVSKNHLLEKME